MNIATEVVDVVLRDVARASPLGLTIDPTPFERREGEGLVRLTADGRSSAGIAINEAQSRQERLTSAASQVQDWLVERLAEHAFEPIFPPCPEHPQSHPLNPEAGNWVCPRSRNVIAAIGSL